MKIYIVGSVASGKTTFAKKLSERTGIECTHLDGIVHIKDETNKVWGNIRRDDAEIIRLFNDVISNSKWIIEDAGRTMFIKAMEEADLIIHLNPSSFTRKIRIFTRFIKQNLGLEDCLYTPNLRMIKFMYKAAKKYDKGNDDLTLRLANYSDKIITLKTNRAVKKYLVLAKNRLPHN